jgi:hypothetical protein
VRVASRKYIGTLRFANARCADGELIVSQIGTVPRSFFSRVSDHVMGAGNYHPIEFQLFYMNLPRNVAERVEAFLSAAGE